MRSTLAGLALLLLAAPALAQDKTVIGTRPQTGANAQPPRLSPAIRVGNLLWVSGQLGLPPRDSTSAANGIAEQTTRSLQNTERLVKEAGTTMDHGVKCTVFLIDMADFQGMNEAYVKFFTKDPPTRSTVQVVALAQPTAKVEIECMFVMPGGAK